LRLGNVQIAGGKTQETVKAIRSRGSGNTRWKLLVLAEGADCEKVRVMPHWAIWFVNGSWANAGVDGGLLVVWIKTGKLSDEAAAGGKVIIAMPIPTNHRRIHTCFLFAN
jgi:hypothetical protein